MSEAPVVFDLPKVLEALLFSTSEPLTVKDIQVVFGRFHDQVERVRGKFDNKDEEDAEILDSDLGFPAELIEQVPALITSTQIRDAIDGVNERMQEAGSCYQIQETSLGFRMVVVPELGYWVRLLRENPKPMKLSQPALETLSIIAYRQPATRSEMEAIRGVSVDSALQRLVEYELVYVVGRADLPGRPVQYGTTDRFLEFVGIRSIDELPATDVLSPQQLDEWIQQANEPEHVGDATVGLPSNEEDNEENHAANLVTDEDQEDLPLDAEDPTVMTVDVSAGEDASDSDAMSEVEESAEVDVVAEDTIAEVDEDEEQEKLLKTDFIRLWTWIA